MYDNIVMDSQHLPPGVQLAGILGQGVADELMGESAKVFADSA